MAFKAGVGKSDFAALREENAYYVDKTELIYELVHDTNNMVTLFTRPRRFGKTLMMSMIENFFSIRKSSGGIFEGLSITKHEDFCKQWMNQYPVLFISFKDVEGVNFDGAYGMLKTKLADLCKDLAKILSSSAADKDDEEVFFRLKAQKADETAIKSSLKTMTPGTVPGVH